MQPYYHPTSIAIIDDDRIFLESFSFYLSDDFRCETFYYPEEGLRHIQHKEDLRHQAQHLTSGQGDMTIASGAKEPEEGIKWGPSAIYQSLQSTHRFERISVAIVDYDMPGMNGLDLLRKIAGYPIKKMLLTGKTSIETALSALKEGIIDCFLMKQDLHATNKIHYEIERLQKQYFENIATLLKTETCKNRLNFIENSVFQATFEKLIHNRNIKEYYLSACPPGMLLIQNDGSISFLHVNTEKDILESIRNAERYNAPKQLITLLKTKKVLTVFPTTDARYSPEHEKNWNNYIWPAQKLKAPETNWYLSLIDNAALPVTLQGKIVSYNDFLRSEM